VTLILVGFLAIALIVWLDQRDGRA